MNEIERKHANARISRIVCYGGLAFPCGQTVLGEVVNLKRFKTRVRASSRRNTPRSTARGSAEPTPNA